MIQENTDPRILTKAPSAFAYSAVKHLGCRLYHFRNNRQAELLKSFARKAKSFKSLDPLVKPLVAEVELLDENCHDRKLIINSPVEIDTCFHFCTYQNE